MLEPENLGAEAFRAYGTLGTSTREPLEKCTCGQHFDCPDGWHRGEDLPCACRPDCTLEDEA